MIRFRDIPIIVVTGSTETDSLADAFQAGAPISACRSPVELSARPLRARLKTEMDRAELGARPSSSRRPTGWPPPEQVQRLSSLTAAGSPTDASSTSCSPASGEGRREHGPR
jgi:hypothetical protein